MPHSLGSPEAEARLRRAWAQNIKWARRDAGMTQAELAAATGVGQQNVSRWELGLSAPPDSLRPVVAQALGRVVYDLFSFDERSVA